MTNSSVLAVDPALIRDQFVRDDPKDVFLDLEAEIDGGHSGCIQSGGKTGKRSSARKMSSARYNDGAAPSSHKTHGAFGREAQR
jgi:hypothetical protein